MTFYFHESGTIGRTIYETDCRLFSILANRPYDVSMVDQRLLIMLTTGILNRSLNLEKELVAALGQEWTFHQPVNVGQTIYCQYEVELMKEQKKVYQIHISLYVDEKVTTTGIWTIMLKQLLNERI